MSLGNHHDRGVAGIQGSSRETRKPFQEHFVVRAKQHLVAMARRGSHFFLRLQTGADELLSLQNGVDGRQQVAMGSRLIEVRII